MFENIVGTGCSFVKDQYKHESKLHFLHLLAKEFNCKTYNVGYPGLSNDVSYLSLIRWMNENIEKVGSTLFIFGITQFTRIHVWNNIIDNHDTLHLSPKHIKTQSILQNIGMHKKSKNQFPNLCDLENEEKIKSFIEIYVKYFYNETFFENKLEQKLIFLHNSVENQGGKLILFNSLDNFEPNTKKLNFLDLRIHENQKINNWEYVMNSNREKIKNDINGWSFHSHPGFKAHSWLSEKIISFLGENDD